MIVLLTLAGVALAVDPVDYTAFDLAAGAIALPAGHGLPEGEFDVRLLVPGGGQSEAPEACRLTIDADAIEALPGRRCSALWRNPYPPTVVVSVGGAAVPLRPSMEESGEPASSPLPKADAWSGYDRNKLRWITWQQDTVPDGVVWALSVGDGDAVYARNGDQVTRWSYDPGSEAIAAAEPSGPEVAEPVAPEVAPAPAGREARDDKPRPERVRGDKPPRQPRERPTRERPVAAQAEAGAPVIAGPAWRWGAFRLGLGAVFGDAVDHGYGVRTAGVGSQGEVVRTAVAPLDLDAVVGYAPFVFTRGRDPSGCGRALDCLAPYVGLSVAGQAGASVEWLKAAHLGVDVELSPAFAIQLTGVARRVTRLADGVEVGSPANTAEPAPTVETFGLGAAVILSATPRLGR